MAATNRVEGVRRIGVVAGIAAGAVLAAPWLAAGGAAAGQWTITPRVGATQAITDNARSTTADTDTDLISTATAGIGVLGDGARVQVSFDYDLSYDKYWQNDDLDGMRQNLLGDGTAELYREHLFFDARAAVSQQAITRRDVQTATGRTAAANQTVVVNYALGPYLRNRFGDWAESELRYRFSQTLFVAPDVGDGGDSAPEDATTHQATATLASGRRFTRYRWNVTGDTLTTERADDATVESRRLELAGEYDVNRFATLLGQTGYETIDDQAGEDVSGLTWRFGARLTPGPRTLFRLEYGRRFEGSVWSGELIYRLSSRTELVASYEETRQTDQQQLGANLARIERDEIGRLIDPATGGVADPNDPTFDLRDQSFQQRRLTAALVGQRGRNKYRVSSFYTTRDSTSGAADETIFGGAASLGRRLTPKLDAGLDASFSARTKGGSGDDQIYRAALFAAYDFNKTLTGAVRYGFFHNQRDGAGDLTENVLSVSLRKDF